jgi:DNA-binding transcriptional ArsR family regulator
LERAFHEKARLGIMTSLVTSPDGLSFSELKDLCTLSDGNLSRHLEVLRDAGFVGVQRVGGGRSARTTCVVTNLGRSAFFRYLAELERVIADAKDRSVAVRQSRNQSSPGGRRETSLGMGLP